MTSTLGVALIGAGPVTHAIHLPTLASLADRLHISVVMDVDPVLAGAVAQRCAARATTSLEDALADPAVDLVAICSPGQFHAEQVVAAVTAGKRGVLCEKPLATTADEAARIRTALAGGPCAFVVGAMHAYDPAWVAASAAMGELARTATLVRSAIYLPANEEFTGLATDPPPTSATARPPGGTAPDVRPAALVRMGILGLATHTIPHLRRFFPQPPELASARYVAPWGYHLVFEQGGRIAELLALMPGDWEPDWRLDAWGPGGSLHLRYPPSYVLAGSAHATLIDAAGSGRSWQADINGYQAEWRHLADVVTGRAVPSIPAGQAIDDLLYALAIADAVDTCLEKTP
ncbi:MAG TPA: Gfo/Idh/MocA family oxidoreductase [Rugosimonospora sp.]|nr:Gfo/Idh/MocA family oxidoreductase [Rugosimonospora sp.]